MTINSRLVIFFLLIPLLCFFTYQAIKSSIAAVQLTNIRYLLQQNTQYGLTEEQFIEKTQTALDTVERLTVNDPNYHKLQANLKLWQAFGYTLEQEMITQAIKHYRIALQDQPNNPHLWYRLAQTDASNPKKEYTLNAIEQAAYYAPSDKTLLLNVLLWKLPMWQQLNLRQQKDTINQLKQLIQAKWSTRKNRQQIKQLLKNNGQKISICSKLPRTEKFKAICY